MTHFGPPQGFGDGYSAGFKAGAAAAGLISGRWGFGGSIDWVTSEIWLAMISPDIESLLVMALG